MPVFRVMKNENYTVMSNYHLRDRNLSLKAVGLLSKMLSFSEEWNYTNRGLAAICKEGVDAIGSALRELEQYGYLVRKQLRSETGRILDTEYIIYEAPQSVTQINASAEAMEPCEQNVEIGTASTEPSPVEKSVENVESESESDMTLPYPENPYPADTAQINKNIRNTNSISINPSVRPERKRPEYEAAVSLIRENIEYPVLLERYKRERIDMIVDLAAEMLCTPSDEVAIGKEKYPYDVVKNRMLRLDCECVGYVFDCLRDSLTGIRCMKPYLQKILFNAPVIMDSYIEAKANICLQRYYENGGVLKKQSGAPQQSI